MGHKKSRKHDFGRGSGGGVNLGLIITPMLDMAFQLLAFFVMTYHPPINVGYVEGTLLPPSRDKEPVKAPKEKEKKIADVKTDKNDKNPVVKEKKEDKKIEDEEPELKGDVLLVVVRTVKEGQKEGPVNDQRVGGDPSFVEIRRPEALTPVILSLGPNLGKKEFVKELKQKLDAELKKILNEPGNLALKNAGKTAELKLEVEGKLKHGYWMTFYDTCKLAGYQDVHFVAPSADAQIQPR